jgi:hypothetical protein
MTQSFVLLAWLLVGHVVCDYALQNDFIAKAKNHKAPIPGIPFYQALGAHALMHAGAVALLTGSWVLGGIEFVVHCAIDYAKCDGRTTLNQDQALHWLCKLAYVLILFFETPHV